MDDTEGRDSGTFWTERNTTEMVSTVKPQVGQYYGEKIDPTSTCRAEQYEDQVYISPSSALRTLDKL
jgi:hypothetical protein